MKGHILFKRSRLFIFCTNDLSSLLKEIILFALSTNNFIRLLLPIFIVALSCMPVAHYSLNDVVYNRHCAGVRCMLLLPYLSHDSHILEEEHHARCTVPMRGDIFFKESLLEVILSYLSTIVMFLYFSILLFTVTMLTITIIWLLHTESISIIKFLWFALHSCFIICYMLHQIYILGITETSSISPITLRQTVVLVEVLLACCEYDAQQCPSNTHIGPKADSSMIGRMINFDCIVLGEVLHAYTFLIRRIYLCFQSAKI